MGSRPETPFDNIENSHEYVCLLADAIEEAAMDVQIEISLTNGETFGRRKQALQIVQFKLVKLAANMRASRLLLNDLRTLRRLLLQERNVAAAYRDAAS